MISFHFALHNPWSDRFENIWYRHINTPFDNKFIELELFRTTEIVNLRFTWTIRQSHAGLSADIGFMGFTFHVNIYDGRDWNYSKNEYC